MGLLTSKEYAALRGVTAQAVSKAIKTGRLSVAAGSLVLGSGKKPKIDAEAADREWFAKSDQSKQRGDGAAAPVSAKTGNTPTRASGLPHGETVAPIIDYQKSRGEREHYLAQTARLEFEEKAKLLVSADAVGKQWQELASLVRGKVMGIHSEAKALMPELSIEQIEKIQAISLKALADIADAGEAMAEASNG